MKLPGIKTTFYVLVFLKCIIILLETQIDRAGEKIFIYWFTFQIPTKGSRWPGCSKESGIQLCLPREKQGLEDLSHYLLLPEYTLAGS